MKGGLGGSLPIVGTEVARSWDHLYIFLVALSLFFFILVVGGMIYFAIKYRAGRPGKTSYIEGNVPLEIAWTVVPTVLLLVIFAWGWFVYRKMVEAPPNSYEVRVIGKQWLWQFIYDDGRTTTGDLFVPVSKPVKLIMTSEDVLHSFFVPNFRVKQDVVPGLYTTVWFEATVTGKHHIFCAEYCGAAHSGMLGSVVVLNDEDWEAWKKGKPISLAGASEGAGPGGGATAAGSPAGAVDSLVAKGEILTKTKGCIACHSADGSQRIGPSYKGLFGHDVELADGSKVKADENYLRESIENPAAKVVKGFNPVMPVFKGQLSESEMAALIAYIKSVK